MPSAPPVSEPSVIAFVGGGNMASAIIGGLRRNGIAAERILVAEPAEVARQALRAQHGVQAVAAADATFARADVVVWAVKPQVLRDAASAIAPWLARSLHLSIAAGIPSGSLAQWLQSERIVRAMPNTPALVGQGVTGLFARGAVGPADRQWVELIAAAVGQFLWLDDEAQLDAVTAISGSGPAYVFYFLEALREAGAQLGLDAEQAYRLAVATFEGGAALAAQSGESPEVLRERVTSKGGTTFAATSALDELGVKSAFIQAIRAAHRRAQELGRELA